MQAYKTDARIAKEGELYLSDLPFHAGDDVEVIVLQRNAPDRKGNAYPLRGKPIRYDDPTEPVAVEDWDALR